MESILLFSLDYKLTCITQKVVNFVETNDLLTIVINLINNNEFDKFRLIINNLQKKDILRNNLIYYILIDRRNYELLNFLVNNIGINDININSNLVQKILESNDIIIIDLFGNYKNYKKYIVSHIFKSDKILNYFINKGIILNNLIVECCNDELYYPILIDIINKDKLVMNPIIFSYVQKCEDNKSEQEVNINNIIMNTALKSKLVFEVLNNKLDNFIQNLFEYLVYNHNYVAIHNIISNYKDQIKSYIPLLRMILNDQIFDELKNESDQHILLKYLINNKICNLEITIVAFEKNLNIVNINELIEALDVSKELIIEAIDYNIKKTNTMSLVTLIKVQEFYNIS